MNFTNQLAELKEKLDKAGIPTEGVARLKDGSVRLDYVGGNDGVTPQQRAQAEAIVAAFDWNATSPSEVNEASLRTKIRNAISTLETADNNWGSLTAGQKDAAIRLSVRVAAKLGRLALTQFDTD